MEGHSIQLDGKNFGIICIAPENQTEPRIHFEAGALAKTIGDTTYVYPYLIDLKPRHSLAGPLTSGKIATEGGTCNLIEKLNRAAKKARLHDARLGRTFDKYWLNLWARITSLPPAENTKAERSSMR